MRRVVIAKDRAQFNEFIKQRARGAALVIRHRYGVIVDQTEYLYPIHPDYLKGLRCLSHITLEGGTSRPDYQALMDQLDMCNVGCSESTIEPDNEL